MKEDENDLQPMPIEESAGEMSEAEIDANLEGTFPASDPPAWTLGSDHPSPTTGQKSDDDSD